LVLHVGRAGAVAGGMSQVVNSYLATDFEQFRAELISTRDGSGGLQALTVFARGVRRFMRHRPDSNTVVVVHLSQDGSFIREGMLLLVARLRGFGCVAQLHGSNFVSFAERHSRIARRVLGAAHVVHVLSPNMRRAVLSLTPQADVRLIPNAVERGDTAEKGSTVVFGGAVSVRKGVDILIEAWEQSQAASRGWELLVAGPMADLDLSASRIDGVRILGQVNHVALMRLLEASSIAVLPSRDEAMPLFILEALARRNCVISTDVGGIPEVLADGAGIVIPPGDVEALTNAISRMTSDDAARATVSAAGWRTYTSKYDTAVVNPALEELWSAALTRAMRPDEHERQESYSVVANE
jgi:glycosyltransferase involved in cell wall biosynthesis